MSVFTLRHYITLLLQKLARSNAPAHISTRTIM
jgi:hypothetical protein